jgi:hypothetical protein
MDHLLSLRSLPDTVSVLQKHPVLRFPAILYHIFYRGVILHGRSHSSRKVRKEADSGIKWKIPKSWDF